MGKVFLILFVLQIFPLISPAQDIIINEFMAINDSVYADEYNEFDDWIELYNNTTDTIDLNGWYISDDILNRTKYRFTAIDEELKISPYSYFLIWADDNTEQGTNHAGFKLSGEGEEIGISDPAQYLIHSLIYPAQRKKISMGLAPDSIALWIYFDTATPGDTNHAHYYYGITGAPDFNVSGGIYSTMQEIEITTSGDEDVYYSINNS